MAFRFLSNSGREEYALSYTRTGGIKPTVSQYCHKLHLGHSLNDSYSTTFVRILKYNLCDHIATDISIIVVRHVRYRKYIELQGSIEVRE